MNAVQIAERRAAYEFPMPEDPLLRSSFDLLVNAPQGIAKLRELILALALSGRLVSQNPEDAPADSLLTLSRERVAREMEEGRMKRERPALPVRRHEQRFATPAQWVWCRVVDTGEYINGMAFKPTDWTGSGRPIIRIQNLSGRAQDFNRTNKQVDPSVVVKTGDILVSWSATLDAFIWNGEEGVLNQHIFRVSPAPLVDRSFLFWLLKRVIKELAASDHAHGLVMSHINRGPFLAYPVAIPPLAEQARIVARVEELMQLCDALEAHGRLQDEQHARLAATLFDALAASESARALAENWQRIAAHFDLLLDRPEAVDALEQTILQLAVRGLLVPQDPADEPANELPACNHSEEDRLDASGRKKRVKPLPPIDDGDRMFDIPANWRWARMEAICDAIVDCPHSTAKFVESGVLCIDTNSFKSWKLLPHKLRYVTEKTFEERVARLVPKPGDLVFAREGSVGESVLIPDGTRCCLGQRVMLFRFSSSVLNTYVQMVLSSKDFLDRLLALHKGIGAKHVNVGDMRLASIPLPPLAEQHRIVARVEELRRFCADLRERLQQAHATQSRLADALVNTASQHAGAASVDVTH